jgi:hypothetical protein
MTNHDTRLCRYRLQTLEHMKLESRGLMLETPTWMHVRPLVLNKEQAHDPIVLETVMRTYANLLVLETATWAHSWMALKMHGDTT